MCNKENNNWLNSLRNNWQRWWNDIIQILIWKLLSIFFLNLINYFITKLKDHTLSLFILYEVVENYIYSNYWWSLAKTFLLYSFSRH